MRTASPARRRRGETDCESAVYWLPPCADVTIRALEIICQAKSDLIAHAALDLHSLEAVDQEAAPSCNNTNVDMFGIVFNGKLILLYITRYSRLSPA